MTHSAHPSFPANDPLPGTTTPPPSRKLLSHPAALLILTLLTVPVLLLFLGTGDPVDMMELFNLVPVREAYRDGHWLMPTLNGAPRLEKPPLPVWIPAGVASLFGTDSLWILRLPSLVMALLTAIATYGIGCTLFKNSADLGDSAHSERRYALLAAILLPAMLMFNRQARLASYDIYATAFLTCGAYFLLLIAERDRTEAEREPRGFAWLVVAILAGLCTGLSILSKGPVPVATVMLPLGIWLLLFHRRPRVWVGVLLAALFSLVAFLPWLIAIGGLPGRGDAWVIEPLRPELRHAWEVWSAEFVQFGTGQAANTTAGTKAELTDPPYYYLQMLVWVLPLTPSLIAGLVLPWLPSQGEPQPSGRERRGRWLLWLILVLGLLLLTVPSEKKPRYALQLFPYAALLCAAVWQEFVRFPAAKKVDVAGGLVLASQALFFIVPGAAGVLATLWVAVTGSFPRWEIVGAAVRTISIPLALVLFGAVAASGLYLWHLLARRQYPRAVGVLALCAWVFILAIQSVYKGLPATHTNPVREPVQLAVNAAGESPIVTLKEYRPWLPTLFFANRIIPAIDLHDLVKLASTAGSEDLYVMAVTDNWDRKAKTFTRMAGFDETLAALEGQSGRRPQEVAQWLDESRRTALFRLPARAAATAPAASAPLPASTRPQ